MFLDNAGEGFKTIAVQLPSNMYDLVVLMKKKVFTDTEGFGIWEVKDKKGIHHPRSPLPLPGPP